MEWVQANIEVVAAILTGVVYAVSRIWKLNNVWKSALLLVASQIEAQGGDIGDLKKAIALESGKTGGTVKDLITAVAEKVDAKKSEHKGVRFLKFLLKVAVPFIK